MKKTSIKKSSLLWLLLLLTPVSAFSQSLNGVVLGLEGKDTIPLYMANIWWADQSSGTQSDEKGRFTIQQNKQDNRLIFQYVGYERDTILANTQFLRVIMQPEQELKTFVKAARIDAQKIEVQSLALTRDLTEKTLRKAPCCNLAESFENTPAVDISYSDALTGARRIEMLGLAGKYALITRELIPVFRGFSGANGMAFIPGQWLSGIQLTKGAGPVTSGPESISGHINVELKKPENADPLFVNIYSNQGLRTELNLIGAASVNDQLSTAVFLHGNARPMAWDMNKDGFSDMPVGQQFNVLNRWKYQGDNGYEGMLSVHYVNDKKRAGDMNFVKERIWPQDILTSNFPVDQNQESFDAFLKAGRVFGEKNLQSFGLQTQFSHYTNDSRFRTTNWSGVQNRFYLNFIYQISDSEERHTFKMGPNMWVETSMENVFGDIVFSHPRFPWEPLNFDRQEQVYGAFAEYSWKSASEKMNFSYGMYAGRNLLFERTFLAPRAHFRWEFLPKTVLRASAGRGIQSPSVFTDNFGALASNRRWILYRVNSSLPYGLEQEIANNYGISIQRNFKWLFREGNLQLDYFFTGFEQQVVADWYESSRELHLYMLNGNSRAHAFQVEWNWEPMRRFELHAAYRYHEIRTDYRRGYLLKPLVPLHRTFLNAAYTTKNNWMFDFTLQYFGRSRMPYTGNSPEAYRLSNWTDPYPLAHAQISKSWKKRTELYFGAENLLNFRIPRAIVGETGNSPYFDSSMIWGPVFGRMFFLGLRWTPIEKNKEEG